MNFKKTPYWREIVDSINVNSNVKTVTIMRGASIGKTQMNIEPKLELVALMNEEYLINEVLKIPFDEWVKEIVLKGRRQKWYTFFKGKQIYFTLRSGLLHPFFTINDVDIFLKGGYSKEVEKLENYLYGKQ